MKIPAILILCASLVSARAGQMWFLATNSIGMPDTNIIRILPLNTNQPITANGQYIVSGIASAVTPNTNGFASQFLMQGFYVAASRYYQYAFQVPDSSSNVYWAAGWQIPAQYTYVIRQAFPLAFPFTNGPLPITGQDSNNIWWNTFNGGGLTNLQNVFWISNQSATLPQAQYPAIIYTLLGGEFIKTNSTLDASGWRQILADP